MITYLDYYLDRKDLWFDQLDVYCALEYLDKKETTRLFDKWNSFVADKRDWSLESAQQRFRDSIAALETINRAKNQI